MATSLGTKAIITALNPPSSNVIRCDSVSWESKSLAAASSIEFFISVSSLVLRVASNTISGI